MQFPDSWFEDEVRDGFYVPALMKRAWAAELEVLDAVAKVCEKYQIRWFADFGTLLGAVRHGGFIPWDDDIDISMLREDYERFNAVAVKELPEGFYVPQNSPDEYRSLTRVCNGISICAEKERLEKYHGFPYVAGIDIFALDYIAPNPEDEEFRKNLSIIVYNAAITINQENQDTNEMKALASQIEELLHVKLDRNKSIKDQLYALREGLFSLYTADEATEVARMPSWIFNRSPRYPLELFRNTVMLPFEVMELPAPSKYDEALRIKFGDYMKPCRFGGDHDYPGYKTQRAQLTEAIGEENLPYQYRFSAKDLIKPDRYGKGTGTGKTAADFLHMAGVIHKEMYQSMETNSHNSVEGLLETCQNLAIHTGTILEQNEGENAAATVAILEEYCELIWQIHQKQIKDPGSTAEDICNRLNQLLVRFETSFRENIRVRREIVLLPWKASMWNSLEPVWLTAMTDPDCDVYVIPIPYYYRNLDGSFKEMQYEGDRFPDNVPITDYNSYDFENRQPDMIFIQNPYDECNMTTSVHPFFYSGNLKQYTGQLVYLPYFTLDESEPNDPKTFQNMKYYVTTPGVIHADRVIVQSDQMRKGYIDYLTQFAGENTRSVWEEKIQGGYGHVFS